MNYRICALCGCTDLEACRDLETGATCSWVEGYPCDVCSFCVHLLDTSSDSSDPPRRVTVRASATAER